MDFGIYAASSVNRGIFYLRATIEIDGRSQCPGENPDAAALALIVTFYISDWFLVGSYDAYENGRLEISLVDFVHFLHCNRTSNAVAL